MTSVIYDSKGNEFKTKRDEPFFGANNRFMIDFCNDIKNTLFDNFNVTEVSMMGISEKMTKEEFDSYVIKYKITDISNFEGTINIKKLLGKLLDTNIFNGLNYRSFRNFVYDYLDHSIYDSIFEKKIKKG